MRYLIDNRWNGKHGLGRVTHLLQSHLGNTNHVLRGASLSIRALLFDHLELRKACDVFISAGPNIPLFFASRSFVFLHDVIILTERGQSSWIKQLYLRIYFPIVSSRVRGVFTVSQYSKEEIIRVLKISPSRIHVIYNGIKSSKSKKWRGGSNLLFVGNCRSHKNVYRLLKMLKHLPSWVHLDMVTSLTTDVREFIDKQHLSERVHIYSDLTESDMRNLYERSQCLVYPSVVEGFGLPMLEAFSVGLPVIASNIPVFREIGGTAFISFNQCSSLDMAKVVMTYLDDKELQEEYSNRGFQRHFKFSESQQVKEILNKVHK